MGLWQRLFGAKERPEETLRLTRRAIDLLGEGKSDDEVKRTLFREGVSVERAASLLEEVRRVQRMVRGRTIVAALGISLLWATAQPAAAQQPADSARSPASDTTRRQPGDTTRRAPGDTTRAAGDTTRPAPSDTASRPRPDTSAQRAAPPPAQTIVAPADSTLAGACQGVRSGGVAANLLVVVFRPDASQAQLAAISKAVRGTLLGLVPGGDGAYYLRVPAEGDDHLLGASADRVIQYPQVQQVGPTVCPATPTGQSAPGP